MLYLPITKTWIVSQTANRVYFICALLTLSLLGAWFAIRFAMVVTGTAVLSPDSEAALLIRLLLGAGILGAAVLSIAMWYFWFGFDNSNWIKKAIWFLPLYLLLALGPALYYFFVYRRACRRLG